jgi:formylglycine-generating enzyme required for sulfatase activity
MRPLRVFLCHASQDKPAVRELYTALIKEGWINPWLDKAKILPGQDWEIVIEKAVEESDVVVVCLSNQSVTKEGYVQREIRYAYDIALEKPEETIFLIPLRLNECNVPRKLRSFHWVDYFGVDKESSYSDLLEALKFRYDQKMIFEVAELERKQREKIEREAAEGLAREKAAHEKRDREQKEKADREAKEFARRQTEARAPEKEKLERPKLKGPVPKPSPKFDPRLFGLGGVILVGLVFWGISALLNDQPTANPLGQNTATATAPVLTKTPTKAPSTATNTPPPTFTPTPGIGSAMTSEKDGMVIVFVPAGEFTMGGDSYSIEQPIHQVNLDAFWIDQTEVTNAMYAKCVNDNQCPPKNLSSHKRSDYFGNPEFDTYPVLYIDWNMAKAYCEWAGRRLPTEAEWEKAARGTDGRIYPWGNASPNNTLLNYNRNVDDTTEVGKYPAGASPYGAYDMAGNVWEWVSSLYQPYPYDAGDGRENSSSSGSRVLRGGSWYNDDYFVRSTYRIWYAPTSWNYGFGFRCSLSQP